MNPGLEEKSPENNRSNQTTKKKSYPGGGFSGDQPLGVLGSTLHPPGPLTWSGHACVSTCTLLV